MAKYKLNLSFDIDITADEDFNSIINGAFIMVEKSFNDLRNELEEINAGEFLHDDWEIVE